MDQGRAESRAHLERWVVAAAAAALVVVPVAEETAGWAKQVGRRAGKVTEAPETGAEAEQAAEGGEGLAVEVGAMEDLVSVGKVAEAELEEWAAGGAEAVAAAAVAVEMAAELGWEAAAAVMAGGVRQLDAAAWASAVQELAARVAEERAANCLDSAEEVQETEV
jgi:hypothetical protein